MDGAGRLTASVKSWLGKPAEAIALYRATRAARRRARQGRLYIRRGTGSALALLFLAGSGIAGFFIGGHEANFRREYGAIPDAVARAFGFGINEIAVEGASELQRDEVIALSGLDPRASLPFLDPKALQDNLAREPLIAEATIAKLYPDRLSIHIRERVPFAIWQLDGDVKVVAADGTAIEPFSDARFLRLPHVVGKEANLHVKDYVALLEAVPELGEKVRAGTLVAGRRWNLKLANGVDLKLPEEGAVEALRRFWAIEKEHRLRERAVLAIDLRLADRIALRLTEEAATEHAEKIAERVKKLGGRV